MNTLNLNAIGLQEMNVEEMRNIDGGIHPLVYILAWSMFENWDDVRSGWSDARR